MAVVRWYSRSPVRDWTRDTRPKRDGPRAYSWTTARPGSARLAPLCRTPQRLRRSQWPSGRSTPRESSGMSGDTAASHVKGSVKSAQSTPAMWDPRRVPPSATPCSQPKQRRATQRAACSIECCGRACNPIGHHIGAFTSRQCTPPPKASAGFRPGPAARRANANRASGSTRRSTRAVQSTVAPLFPPSTHLLSPLCSAAASLSTCLFLRLLLLLARFLVLRRGCVVCYLAFVPAPHRRRRLPVAFLLVWALPEPGLALCSPAARAPSTSTFHHHHRRRYRCRLLLCSRAICSATAHCTACIAARHRFRRRRPLPSSSMPL